MIVFEGSKTKPSLTIAVDVILTVKHSTFHSLNHLYADYYEDDMSIDEFKQFCRDVCHFRLNDYLRVWKIT